MADEQSVVPVDVARWQRLAQGVLAAEGVRGGIEMSLLFIGELEMAELNEQFLAKSGPTDVLAFPIDAVEVEITSTPGGARRGPDRAPDDPEDMPLLLGDVVVCPAVALANAPTHAGNLDDELALLVVHGILHIMGHDHHDPEETTIMRARERELLESLHWKGPMPEGFRQEQD